MILHFVLVCIVVNFTLGGKQMPKLANKKLCADEDCSHPISIAVAKEDYMGPDCRFLSFWKGQRIYVYSKLRGIGRLFWSGSVEGDYYGEQTGKLGYFPSSIVQVINQLKPGTVDVPTEPWDFHCF